MVLAAPYSNWWPGAATSHYTQPDHINASTINWMAQASLDVVYAYGFDGVNFDIGAPCSSNSVIAPLYVANGHPSRQREATRLPTKPK
eukprot:SAG31_NODE_5900_length_2264_cov_4.540878_2_plen_88_part_00